MHPIFDTSHLSDEELITRLGKAYKQLDYQTQFGRIDTINSIKFIIDALEGERVKRIEKITHDRHPINTQAIDLGTLE